MSAVLAVRATGLLGRFRTLRCPESAGNLGGFATALVSPEERRGTPRNGVSSANVILSERSILDTTVRVSRLSGWPLPTKPSELTLSFP